jgi:hypothetical protein
MSLARLNQVDAGGAISKLPIAQRRCHDGPSSSTLGAISMQKKQKAEGSRRVSPLSRLVPKAPDADKLKATVAQLKKGAINADRHA